MDSFDDDLFETEDQDVEVGFQQALNWGLCREPNRRCVVRS